MCLGFPDRQDLEGTPTPTLPRSTGRGRIGPVVLGVFSCILTVGCGTNRSTATAPARPTRVLHVVADPNNLPFSNDRLEGFENRLAGLLGRDVGAQRGCACRRQGA